MVKVSDEKGTFVNVYALSISNYRQVLEQLKRIVKGNKVCLPKYKQKRSLIEP